MNYSPREADLLDRCMQALGARTAHAFFVPGRIEVFGKHTDYAGGRSLLAAAERGFVIAAAARSDDRVFMTDVLTGERVELTAADVDFAPSPWLRYPLAVLRRVTRDFPTEPRGADIAFASNLPPAAGLSSSSALVVATFLAIDAVRRVRNTAAFGDAVRDDDELAAYLAAAESGRSSHGTPGSAGVGTHGGSEDHTAILCARPDQLVQYRFAPTRFERAVAMTVDHVFVIGVSGVRAEKTGAAQRRYNELAAAAARMAALWREATGSTAATPGDILEETDPAEAVRRLRGIIETRAQPAERRALLARLEQFATESDELVPGAAAALADGDLDAFGAFAERSQQLAADGLRNQVPETMQLAASARALGAVGASAFGAGFGGSAWALVRAADAAAFEAAWRAAYLARFPQHAGNCTFFSSRAGAPARRLG